MSTAAAKPPDPNARRRLSAGDYAELARAELATFVSMLESLGEADWSRPTPCTLWDVHGVAAHQAGHVQSGHGLLGVLAQANPIALRAYRKRGMSTLDGMNQKQVDLRRDRTPAELIREIRDGTADAIAARTRLNPISSQVRLPVPPAGMMPLRELLQRIFSRDMWIHRLDIADATGRPFDLAGDHNALMLALVVEDTARFLRKARPSANVSLHLSGDGGGDWQLASGEGTPVSLSLSVADFVRRTAGRVPLDETAGRVSSGASAAELRPILEALQAPY